MVNIMKLMIGTISTVTEIYFWTIIVPNRRQPTNQLFHHFFDVAPALGRPRVTQRSQRTPQQFQNDPNMAPEGVEMMSQIISQSFSQPAIQSVSQSISQSVGGSVNHPVSQSAKQPAVSQ